MKAFMSIFDIESQGKGINSMIKWNRDVSLVLPQQYKNILLFNISTGPYVHMKLQKIKDWNVLYTVIFIGYNAWKLKEITIQHIKKELDIMEMML